MTGTEVADDGAIPPVDVAAPPGRREVGGRDLPTSIAVGLGLAGAFLGSLFWHPAAFAVVITVLIVAAVWEAAAELKTVGVVVRAWPLALASVVTVWGAYHDGSRGQAYGIALVFAVAVGSQLADHDRTDVLRRMAITVFLGVWTGFLASFAVLLRLSDDGTVAALGVIGAAIFTDIGGFAFGVKFGRTKITPRISPNKSLEGLIGGLLLSVALAALVLPRLGDLFDVPTAIAMAVLAGVGGFIGDLVESMIKRDVGIKDFGRLIPGHGGVLDRVDGILVALPLGFYAIELFGARNVEIITLLTQTRP